MNDQQKIAAFLETHELSSGLGSESKPCSIAAINLALTGKLTDKIPDCMSRVIGRWIIAVQDTVPHDVRNSVRWKALLPAAAGTGRGHEQERCALILAGMFDRALPSLQGLADEKGFGAEWRNMLTLKTYEAAYGAFRAARAAGAYADAADAADAAYGAARAVAVAARAEDAAAEDAAAAECAYGATGFWQGADPCELLEQLIAVSAGEGK